MKARLPSPSTTLAILLTGSTLPGSAVDYSWTGGVSSKFSDNGNWSLAGYPNDGADRAFFSLAGSYQVDFDENIQNQSLHVSFGSPTLNLLYFDFEVGERAYDYTLSSPTVSADISGNPFELFPPVLEITGSVATEVAATGALHIGSGANTRGTLRLADGARWNSTAFAQVGVSGRGTLVVENNSSLNNSTGILGQNPGSQGSATIEGTWNNSSNLLVGWFGTGTLSGDGVVRSNYGFVAAEPGSQGTVNMDGSWRVTESLIIGGDLSGAGGIGIIDMNTGLITAGTDLILRANATMDLQGTGGAAVDGETKLEASSSLTIDGTDASLTTGTLTRDPAATLQFTKGTIEITNGDFLVQPNGTIGTNLTLGTAHSLIVSDALRIASNGGGSLIIENGAEVTAASVLVGIDATAQTEGALEVDGLNSLLTADFLGIGAFGGELGKCAITDGASLITQNVNLSSRPDHKTELIVQGGLPGEVSTWSNSGSVYVGGNSVSAGGKADVTIGNQAAVSVDTQLKVWNDGTILLEGGTLTTPSLQLCGAFMSSAPVDLTGSGEITALTLDGGTLSAPSIDFGSTNFTGHGILAGDVRGFGSITLSGDLTIGTDANPIDFSFDGVPSINGHTLTIHETGFLPIDDLSLGGGTFQAPNGFSLRPGSLLSGYGTMNGRIAGSFGSRVEAEGTLSIGDPASVAGFFSDGELYCGVHDVTIEDANVAVLGSITEIGEKDVGGRLIAGTALSTDTSPHLLVEEGKNLLGRGNVEGNCKVNGAAIGDGTTSSELLVFDAPWIVSGKGSFVNTLINGTFSPGESPGIVIGSNQGFGGTIEFELGGPTPGFNDNNHDQINDQGEIQLVNSPTISLKSYSNFLPEVDDEFVLMNWGQGLNGALGTLEIDPFFSQNGITFEHRIENSGGQGRMVITAIELIEPTPFETWAIANGLTPGVNSGFSDDPNGDNIPNIEHFAFDSSPLGSGGHSGKGVFDIHEFEPGERYLTVTVPVRLGALFNVDPSTGANNASVDGIVYSVRGDDGVFEFPLNRLNSETAEALDSGLPALSADYEYRTFRLEGSIGSTLKGFLWLKVYPDTP